MLETTTKPTANVAPVGTVEDASEVLSALKTFPWARESDPSILLGWLGMTYIAGSLGRSPHLSLTGPSGSGKSTLMSLLQKLIGRSCFYANSNISEAGIRQTAGSSSRAFLLDEGEADVKTLSRLLKFLLVASAGGVKQKCKGARLLAPYKMRAMVLLAGSRAPAMRPADEARFIRVELRRPSSDFSRHTHPLVVYGSTSADEVGQRLSARAISALTRFLFTAEMVRERLSRADDRALASLTPAIAMAWCLLNDGVIDEEKADALAASLR